MIVPFVSSDSLAASKSQLAQDLYATPFDLSESISGFSMWWIVAKYDLIDLIEYCIE